MWGQVGKSNMHVSLSLSLSLPLASMAVNQPSHTHVLACELKLVATLGV